MKKTSIKRGMTQHDLTVMSKSRVRKTLRKDIGNLEVGPSGRSRIILTG